MQKSEEELFLQRDMLWKQQSDGPGVCVCVRVCVCLGGKLTS